MDIMYNYLYIGTVTEKLKMLPNIKYIEDDLYRIVDSSFMTKNHKVRKIKRLIRSTIKKYKIDYVLIDYSNNVALFIAGISQSLGYKLSYYNIEVDRLVEVKIPKIEFEIYRYFNHNKRTERAEICHDLSYGIRKTLEMTLKRKDYIYIDLNKYNNCYLLGRLIDYNKKIIIKDIIEDKSKFNVLGESGYLTSSATKKFNPNISR